MGGALAQGGSARVAKMPEPSLFNSTRVLLRPIRFARMRGRRRARDEFKTDTRYSCSGVLVTLQAAKAFLAGRFEDTMKSAK